MTRRFLTAEDVRRHGTGDLVVDPDTVVTPQALEVAQANGVAIRTTGGTYSEPAPDRGPDASGVASAAPAAGQVTTPNPGDFVITAVGRNRAGVLSEITSTVSHYSGNVNDISQKMMGDFFHLILTVSMPAGTPFGEVKQCLECLGGEDDFVVKVMHERVFNFMHRV